MPSQRCWVVATRRSSVVVVVHNLIDGSSFVAPVQTFCNPVIHSLNRFVLYCKQANKRLMVLFLWLPHIQREMQLPKWVTLVNIL